MANAAVLVDRWPIRESRSARVQTMAGHWMWAEVRGRTAAAGKPDSLVADPSRPLARADVEHVLVLQSVDGGPAVGVPVQAVSGRFLRVAPQGARPGIEFGPVDVAVLRRLVVEAAPDLLDRGGARQARRGA
jgi:hypothetical protein